MFVNNIGNILLFKHIELLFCGFRNNNKTCELYFLDDTSLILKYLIISDNIYIFFCFI